MDFIKYIIDTCGERGISVNKMCQESGISAQTFQNWKNGSQPTLEKAMKVIKYLGLSADKIFNIVPDKDSPRPKEIGNYRSLRFKLQDLLEIETNQLKKNAIQDILDDIERYSYNE